MTSCDRANELFGPAWDDELSVDERESLERHFESCRNCREEYDAFARTLELVQSLPRPAVSGDFATRVLAEARRREAESHESRGLARWFGGTTLAWRPAPALAAAAALAVVLGVGGVFWLRPGSVPSSGPSVASRMTATGDADTPAEAQQAAPAPAPATPNGAVASLPAARTPSTAVRHVAPSRADVALAAETTNEIPDSLFDHSADVEFVLDPVKLRRERGRGYTPVPTTVRGENASITF